MNAQTFARSCELLIASGRLADAQQQIEGAGVHFLYLFHHVPLELQVGGASHEVRECGRNSVEGNHCRMPLRNVPLRRAGARDAALSASASLSRMSRARLCRFLPSLPFIQPGILNGDAVSSARRESQAVSVSIAGNSSRCLLVIADGGAFPQLLSGTAKTCHNRAWSQIHELRDLFATETAQYLQQQRFAVTRRQGM